jgi:hypothetical protein
VADRTVDGRPLKMLTVIDEFSRQCMALLILTMRSGPPAMLKFGSPFFV